MAKNKKGGITSLPGTLNILSSNINQGKKHSLPISQNKTLSSGGTFLAQI